MRPDFCIAYAAPHLLRYVIFLIMNLSQRDSVTVQNHFGLLWKSFIVISLHVHLLKVRQ